MRRLLLSLLALTLLVSSCQKDELLNNEFPITQTTTEEIHICTELEDVEDGSNEDANLRGVLLKNNKWPSGTIIKVKFLNGDSLFHEKVKKYATKWAIYANLKFVFVGVEEDADIKIGFEWNGDKSSWSYLGTACKNIAQDKPSMNFGWFKTTTTEVGFRSEILHEFGHALGLQHEHLHPLNTIQWDKPAVYSYFEKQGWTIAAVDKNLFKKCSVTENDYSIYDPNSIMHYRIDKSFTIDGYSAPANTDLSSRDKSFVGQQYPYPSGTKGFYRYHKEAQYCYTSNSEILGDYFFVTLGRVFTSQMTDTHPIYIYNNISNGDRIATLDYDELGEGNSIWRYEGISGYAYKTQQANTIPVYRSYREGAKPTHLLTISATVLAGFKSQGIAFYILRN